ncbi:MAG: hypothetical protein OEW67_11225 [Cyclobacteriaceae bacterium]|nr:hypothetical protein [Cyclobacteriaceae bacterium]
MSSTQNQNSDEIDLKDLFNYIGKAFHSFFERIINFIALIRRVTINYFKYFIVIVSIFLIATLSYYFTLKKETFGSSMLVKSQYLNTQLVDNSINKLNVLAQEKDKTTLAEVLNLEPNTAELINGFEFEPFITEDEKMEVVLLKEQLQNLKLEEDVIGSITEKIELRNPNTFKITILTEENSVINTLEAAIENYFIESDYIKKRIENNRQTLLKRKEKLQKEQIKIDSLKHAIFEVYQSLSKQHGGQGSDNVILAGQEVTNPLSVFREDININDDILAIETALYLKNEFEVIEGLTPFSKPVSISLIKLLVYTVLVGIGFTYLLIILTTLNRFFEQREKQQNQISETA